MPRLSPSDRLAALAVAATEDFGRLGYRGTRTADVARKASMSTGTLFTYVESKEALFHLVFLYGFGLLSEGLPGLPLATPGPEETVELIERELGRISEPAMQAALAVVEPTDVATELREIVEERYSLLERYWRVLAVIERCAVEIPEVERVWFGQARAGTYADLDRYLETRTAAGLLRPMPDVAVAARVVTESLSWFAWHRQEGREALLYDDDAVRRTVTEFICAALLPGPRREQSMRKEENP